MNSLNTRQLLLAAGLPALLACALAVFWMRTGRVPLGGDEPHYLIMAISLIEDGDLKLQNNYEIECIAGEIYGCMEPHAFRLAHAWVPYHQAGLSMLVAPFYKVARVGGARLTTVAIASLLPLLLLAWLRSRLPAADAALLTTATCVSVPMLYGASMIYPDLPGGVAIFGLTMWVLAQPARPNDASAAEESTAPARVNDATSVAPTAEPVLPWLAFWTIAGLLCWLNLKFIAATAVLGLWALVTRWRRDRALTLGAAHVTALGALAGPLSLAAFHYWGFGNLVGGRGGGELTDSPARALLFFLGLHLDQAQGLFVQSPLLLAGIPALVIWARRDPVNAACWLLLYLSLMLPNSLQMGRYGGEGPSGRYGWTAAWLWMIPIGMVAIRHARLLRRAAIASLAYQALLAVRWIPNPILLYPVYDEQLAGRNSLFPPALRAWVPSFYDWSYQSYLAHLPNIIAVLSVALLACAGWLLSKPAHDPQDTAAPKSDQSLPSASS